MADFVASVDKAVALSKEIDVTIAIGDNTDYGWSEIDIRTNLTTLKVFDYHENVGYLGCAERMMDDLHANKEFDYIIICNNDLQIDKMFFCNLLKIRSTHDIGWIAPDIHTLNRRTHENPFLSIRPTRFSFLKWKLLYSNVILYYVIRKLSYRKRRRNIPQESFIYAGNGSFMIFTRDFFAKQEKLIFPSFMYGEEIFLAELMLQNQLKVKVEPSLLVYNIGNVSVSKKGCAWICKQNRKTLKILYRQFFKYNS